MSSLFTQEIKTPDYQITGKKPKISELFNLTKFDEIMQKIIDSELPEELEHFLMSAAARHIVFNYAKIAEFYAHQTPEIQELMEHSALVIVDVDCAIANGYIKFSRMMSEIRAKDGADD